MARYKFIVFSDAISGRAEEYENWYVNTHIPDVLKIPGFISGQQHRVCDDVSTGLPAVGPAYMAEYEIETDDPQGVMRELGTRPGTPAMQISSAIDGSNVKAVFVTPIGELATK